MKAEELRGKEPHAEEQPPGSVRDSFPREPLTKTTPSSRSSFERGQSCKPRRRAHMDWEHEEQGGEGTNHAG